MTAAHSLITGLYEAHLPTDDLDRAVAFYERLGLAVAYRNERVAFVWTEPNRSWLGLWGIEAPESHVAFEVPLAGLERSVEWLSERGIDPVEVNGLTEPQVRPYQANASVYFEDPFGNNLEFMCSLPVDPTEKRGEHPTLDEWLATNREAVGADDEEEVPDEDVSATSHGVVQGLGEAHLPVDDIEEALAFYRDTLGLSVAWRDDEVAFVWTEVGRSWLGLWEGWMPDDHVALAMSLDDLTQCEDWLAERDISLREDSGFTEPYVRPHQPIASAYFHDSEENNLELVCFLSTDPTENPEKVPLREWLVAQRH
jgi:catechol 2,3-dioxygenase-like lactoylglutathione lyase family enzyme